MSHPPPPAGPDVPGSPVQAAAEVGRFLDGLGVAYVVIGGLAVQYWGEPRATQDVDVTVLVPGGGEKEFLQRCLQHFRPRIAGALEFALQHRVLLVYASNGCPVDIALGLTGYESMLPRRARTVSFGGYPVRLIGVEDLIIHKCVAGRPRDLEDVRSILARQSKVDLRYIRRWLDEFQQAVPERDPRGRFEATWREVRRRQ
ncbi:MAG TPA: nucleotidyltransferase [Limnochordales bacterium]